MQVIPCISTTDGRPLIIGPLVFVLSVCGIKDFSEDQKRKKSDNEENSRLVDVLENKEAWDKPYSTSLYKSTPNNSRTLNPRHSMTDIPSEHEFHLKFNSLKWEEIEVGMALKVYKDQ